jgi:prefoldin subunit 2
MKEESQVLAQKISELDQERQEHVLVTETLEKLDSDRKCFRMVGGVLTERTVATVLPAVKDNMDKLTAVINELYGKLQGKEKEMQEFQSKHNIRLRNQPEKRPAPAQDSATSGSGYRV